MALMATKLIAKSITVIIIKMLLKERSIGLSQGDIK